MLGYGMLKRSLVSKDMPPRMYHRRRDNLGFDIPCFWKWSRPDRRRLSLDLSQCSYSIKHVQGLDECGFWDLDLLQSRTLSLGNWRRIECMLVASPWSSFAITTTLQRIWSYLLLWKNIDSNQSVLSSRASCLLVVVQSQIGRLQQMSC